MPFSADPADSEFQRATAEAIRLISDRGYEATTADDLAAATGTSRSTFFRRFGSKDDVVFADHERLLARLSDFLDDSTLPTEDAVLRAARLVLDHHLAQPDTSRERYALLRRYPALRDRELVITRRYERIFTGYLSRGAGHPDWVPVAYGAGIVAVHNAVLRGWLRDTSYDAATALERDLRGLSSVFQHQPVPQAEAHGTHVLVTAYSSDASPDEVVRAVQDALATASSGPQPGALTQTPRSP